jgi:hypothetical protein
MRKKLTAQLLQHLAPKFIDRVEVSASNWG